MAERLVGSREQWWAVLKADLMVNSWAVLMANWWGCLSAAWKEYVTVGWLEEHWGGSKAD